MPKNAVRRELLPLYDPNPSAMKSRVNRVCIYPKDIQRITGKSERYGRDLILKIKNALHKPSHQPVTVQEFCTYMGIPYESIQEHLQD